jgi:cyclophilin family peptidyl-prolyl cis-trans isomerase/protein-disulfide isomerase
MKKIFPFVLLIVALLASCSGNAPTPETIIPTRAPTPTPAPKPECIKFTDETTTGASSSLFPKTSAYDHARGPVDAPITLIAYTDFECEGCAVMAKILDQLLVDYPKELRVIVRYSPQGTEKSPLAIQAAEAAALQDQYWEMHALLFEKQTEWFALSAVDFQVWAADQAEALGLDRAKFESDLISAAIADIPAQSGIAAQTAAQQASIPTLPLPLPILNGKIYDGPPNYEGLRQTIALDLLAKRQFTDCPPIVIDPSKQYTATLHTEKGDIVILLYADKAPNTVNSFVFLAQQGWFDNITFHRVIPGFVAQTGDPSGTGLGGPGYIIINEIDPTLHYDRAGLVGMANSGADTNGSQFFITYAPAPNLDGGYTLFGEVISGMDVLAQITPRDPSTGELLSPGDLIISVTIEEK